MRSRTIPDNLTWLRNNLAQHGLDMSIRLNEQEIKDLCNSLPSELWSKVSNAWKQRNFRREPVYLKEFRSLQRDGGSIENIWWKLAEMDLIDLEDMGKILARWNPDDKQSRQIIKGLINIGLAAHEDLENKNQKVTNLITN
jgi:hypothetical protein